MDPITPIALQMATTAIEILKSESKDFNAKSLILKQFKNECYFNYRLLQVYKEPFLAHRHQNLQIIQNLSAQFASALVVISQDKAFTRRIKPAWMDTESDKTFENKLGLAEVLETRINVMRTLANISLSDNKSPLDDLKWDTRVKNLKSILTKAMEVKWGKENQSKE